MTLEKLLVLCSFLSLISLLSCHQVPDTNASRPLDFDLGEMVDDPGLFFVDSTDLQCSSFLNLLQAFKISLSSTPAFWVEFTEGWHYAPGDPGNGLRVSWEQKPDLDTIIDLPHRINRPNWPLWYEHSLAIREPAYLYVNADDGAQCYLDGILQEPVMGSYFEIETKRIDFVLAGHSHDYERLKKNYGSQQTHFFILGGAGGGLEPPESSAYPKMDTIIKAHYYARFEVNRE